MVYEREGAWGAIFGGQSVSENISGNHAELTEITED
jgi:hypothetical protein